MPESPNPRRTRRQFDDEFEEQAVRLVLDEGKSVAAAGDLDLTETALHGWVKRAQAAAAEHPWYALTVVVPHTIMPKINPRH
jgi:transposase-like protein